MRRLPVKPVTLGVREKLEHIKTVVENLRELAGEVRSLAEELVSRHSQVYRWNPLDSILLNMSGDYGWRDLAPEGKRLQSRALACYRHFYGLVAALLRDQPEDDLAKLKELNETILRVIQQNESTWKRSKEEELEDSLAALESLIGLLDHLYDPSDTTMVVVPDTNALLFNPKFEDWRFEYSAAITIALCPAVLEELDSLKINHRNELVREKSERIIRQLKEYRRRGSLLEGVAIKKGAVFIRSFAREPDVANALPWLDSSNQDDRILASLIEVMRAHPRSRVVLVTRDINLQNKADFARVPFLEPPPLEGESSERQITEGEAAPNQSVRADGNRKRRGSAAHR